MARNVRNNMEKYNSLKAKYGLGFIDPKATAKNINYILVMLKLFTTAAVSIYISSGFFIAINHIIYFAQNILKLFLFTKSQIWGYRGFLSKSQRHCEECFSATRQSHASGLPGRFARRNDELTNPLPIYSILVPMYQEENGVKNIIYHLGQLDYPTKLLDIKLVVEADDITTINIIDSIKLPDHIAVIKVPYSEPRTKPKALNYAMEYIKGEYVVIYDVEDRPEPDQLIKAAYSFNELPEDVICLQAKLRFYNHDTNLLTKLFNIEYQIWFDFLLPAMDELDLVVPLGGNSNHFRVEQLRKLGLWDAYNVTEDADLGLRLFMHGFKTRIIDSYSFEEAPTGIENWIYQRSRWIKGFIQTFLVYLQQNPKLKSNMSIKSRICTYIFIGFSTYSFIFLPWYFIIQYEDNLINIILSKANIYMTFLYMYYSAALLVVSSSRVNMLDITALIIWPFYFMLHIIAGYKALFELMTKPFSWNKTKHFLDEGG